MNYSENLVEEMNNLYSSIYLEESDVVFEDVCNTIILSLLYEGLSAYEIIEYLQDTPESDIVELYINSDTSLLTEDFICEEYITEQLEILSEALPLIGGLVAGAKLAGKALLGKGARAAIGKGVSAVGRGLSVAAKRALGPGGIKLVGGAVSKLKGAANAVGGAVKGVASKLPGPLKTAGKWALGGAAFEGGSRAVKGLLDKNKSSAKSPPTPSTSSPSSPAPSASPSVSTSNVSPKPSKPAPSAQTGDKTKDMATWAKANPKLAAAAAEKARIRGTAQTDNPMIDSDMRSKMPVTPTVQSPEVSKLGPGHQSLTQNKFAGQSPNTPKQKALNQSYEYEDAYDLVLEYLLENGHVDTVDEANYVMMEMDSEMIQSICEAAADQSDKQIEKGIKTTYKGQNVLDNLHQGRSRGIDRLSPADKKGKVGRMRARLKSRRDDLFQERGKREDAKRAELKKLLGI